MNRPLYSNFNILQTFYDQITAFTFNFKKLNTLDKNGLQKLKLSIFHTNFSLRVCEQLTVFCFHHENQTTYSCYVLNAETLFALPTIVDRKVRMQL